MDNPLELLQKALGGIAIRPAGFGYLGRGDGSGVIVADVNKRLLWFQAGVGQPPATARLRDNISILPFIGEHPEFEGIRVQLGFPPENQTVLYITGFDQGEGTDSFKGITPQEQQQSAQRYSDVGSLINLRGAPNNPVDGELYVSPGGFINADGAQDWFGGGSTDPLCADAIALLSTDEHQMGLVYIDGTTGELALAVNTAEAGGVNDKQLFDTTTLTEITLPDNATPCAAVHLYFGQTTVTEEDIYRTADPRILFRNTGSATGTGSSDDSALYLAL